MSAQYGTIAPRRTVELPLWVAGAMALIVLGLIAALTAAQPGVQAKSVATPFVQHAFPGRTVVSTGGAVEPTFPSALEPVGTTAHVPAVVKVAAPSFPSALETSGFGRVPVQTTNAGSRTGGAPQPIMIGDYACHQCA